LSSIILFQPDNISTSVFTLVSGADVKNLTHPVIGELMHILLLLQFL